VNNGVLQDRHDLAHRAILRPGYLAQRPAPQTPEDLRQHQCLHYPRPGDTAAWSFEPIGRKAINEGGRISVPLKGPFAANNSEALREAALAGLGITLLPDFSAQSAIEAGALVELLPGWRPVGAFGTHVWAIRPYAAQVPRGVRALVAWLAEHLAAPGGSRRKR
jgi:DNA-binding transcriptional LysR family regulator